MKDKHRLNPDAEQFAPQLAAVQAISAQLVQLTAQRDALLAEIPTGCYPTKRGIVEVLLDRQATISTTQLRKQGVDDETIRKARVRGPYIKRLRHV